MKALILPLLIYLLSQTAWPVSLFLSKYNLMTDQLFVFLAGVVFVSLSAVGPFLLLRHCITNVDPIMYVSSVFSWTCMIDLGIALELDGYISNFIGYYFAEGEPYLNTAYGTAVNYWDGTAHFLLYIAIISLYVARESHREVGLFWAGSILNSMVVLVPGGVTGNHPFKMSILLNIPYFVLPVLAVFKFFNERPPQSRTFLKFKSIFHRPIDLMFVIFFVAAAGFAAFRGMAVVGGKADAMQYYIKNVEPYLTDPTNFPRLQILVYEHFYFAYYLAAIYGLMYPGKHWMADWSLLHAGASAQAQFSHIFGSVHHRTAKALHAPMTGTAGLIYWTINIALALIPQLFAWRCLTNFEMFGRTYNVDRADLKESQKHVQNNKIIKKVE